MGNADVARKIEARMQEAGLMPAPPPKYRYFQQGNGHMYCWTVQQAEQDDCAECDGHGEVVGEFDTETCPKCEGRGFGKGWYASFVYRAVGKGSRSNDASQWVFDEKSMVKHRKRKDAKARALKLYRADTRPSCKECGSNLVDEAGRCESCGALV